MATLLATRLGIDQSHLRGGHRALGGHVGPVSSQPPRQRRRLCLAPWLTGDVSLASGRLRRWLGCGGEDRRARGSPTSERVPEARGGSNLESSVQFPTSSALPTKAGNIFSPRRSHEAGHDPDLASVPTKSLDKTTPMASPSSPPMDQTVLPDMETTCETAQPVEPSTYQLPQAPTFGSYCGYPLEQDQTIWEYGQLSASPVEQSPVEQSPVDQSPVEQSPVDQSPDDQCAFFTWDILTPALYKQALSQARPRKVPSDREEYRGYHRKVQRRYRKRGLNKTKKLEDEAKELEEA
jgi:hypothetical protein